MVPPNSIRSFCHFFFKFFFSVSSFKSSTCGVRASGFVWMLIVKNIIWKIYPPFHSSIFFSSSNSIGLLLVKNPRISQTKQNLCYINGQKKAIACHCKGTHVVHTKLNWKIMRMVISACKFMPIELCSISFRFGHLCSCDSSTTACACTESGNCHLLSYRFVDKSEIRWNGLVCLIFMQSTGFNW